jgi:hypothetical protein
LQVDRCFSISHGRFEAYRFHLRDSKRTLTRMSRFQWSCNRDGDAMSGIVAERADKVMSFDTPEEKKDREDLVSHAKPQRRRGRHRRIVSEYQPSGGRHRPSIPSSPDIPNEEHRGDTDRALGDGRSHGCGLDMGRKIALKRNHGTSRSFTR